ncbi:hypothetical protein [Trichococcus shcherbakoviae]|uniref:hypothetical protein n=1 Tax=Trichococcus shcherbakoviae TaxID=2094020 RepID=UPI000E5A97A9|nr:hypothetical protein [Trichococcus shcherbakoviae]
MILFSGKATVHKKLSKNEATYSAAAKMSLQELHIIIRPPSLIMKAGIGRGYAAADSANIINGSRDQDDRCDERD